MKFKATLMQAGKTATGIEIPSEVVASLGAGKKPPVCVTINGYSYRNTIAVMGGVFLVGVSAAHRKSANVKAGDVLDVTITLDTQPREVDVPEEFQKALDTNSIARKKFESLSYSKKNGIVLLIKGAKTADTKQRRIEKAISNLEAGNV